MKGNVTIYPRITIATNGKNSNLLEVLEDIRTGTYKAETEKVRDCLKNKGKDSKEYKAAKKAIPYFTGSGTFSKRCEDGLIEHSGFIIIDIDNVNPEETKAIICADPYTFAAFTSVSGNGLAVIVRIDPIFHVEVFNEVRAYYLERYSIEIDFLPDVSRPRFMSYDPDIYLNNLSEAYQPGTILRHHSEDLEAIDNVPEYFTDDEQINFAIRGVESTGLYYKEGARHNFIFKLACFCNRLGVPESVLTQYVSYNYSHFREHPSNAISNPYGRYRNEFGQWKKEKYTTKNRSVRASNLAPNSNGVSRDDREDNDGPTDLSKRIEKAKKFISANWQIRKNEVTEIYEIDGREMQDRDENSIYIELHRNGVKLTKSDVHSIIDSEYTQTYHPIIEWFQKHDTLKPKGLIEKLANSVNQKPYAKEDFLHLLKCWLVGAIAGLFENEKNILELVLCGIQNTGKTEFFRRLLPDALRHFYAESKLDEGKDSEILLCKRFIIMDDEYGGKSKTDVKRHKELLSKDRFTYREPYGRHPVTKNRIASMCGTTNDPEILADTTGNRRVIPVEVLSRDYALYDSIDKVLLWVEVWHLYRAGFDYELTNENIKSLQNSTGEYERFSSEYELITKNYAPYKEGLPGERKSLTTTDLITEIMFTAPNIRINAVQLGKELRRLGFTQALKRMNGKVQRRWDVLKVFGDNSDENSPF